MLQLNYARPMSSNTLVFDFLTKALGLDEDEADELTMDVMKAERLLLTMELKSTIESIENRRPKFSADDKRVVLRRKIFDELISLNRLDDDEDIAIEMGGAKPVTPIYSNSEAIILTGLPASGKSTIANSLADLYGAFVVDSDFAKRKFPEFGHEFGASIVHEESSIVTFGSPNEKYSDEYSLFEFCIAKKHNMIIPKVGSNCESVRELRDTLIDKGYKTHLVLVGLDKQESCRRALYRYRETHRYVPLGLVFDVYSNEPILTYYRVREDEEWESVGKISSLHLRDEGPIIVHSLNNGPVEKLREVGTAT